MILFIGCVKVFCTHCNTITVHFFVAAFSISTSARSFILPCTAHSASVSLLPCHLLLMCIAGSLSYSLTFCSYELFLVLSSFIALMRLIGRLEGHLAWWSYSRNTSWKFTLELSDCLICIMHVCFTFYASPYIMYFYWAQWCVLIQNNLWPDWYRLFQVYHCYP